jgi:hypothetical protein
MEIIINVQHQPFGIEGIVINRPFQNLFSFIIRTVAFGFII